MSIPLGILEQGSVFVGKTLQECINAVSSTGLLCCYDAGDINCVSNATQASWSDALGNEPDFYRGTSFAADTGEPTFNGTPGGKSPNEYWTGPGPAAAANGVFQESGTLMDFAEPFHKDNALFTMLALFYVPDAAPATDKFIFLFRSAFTTTGRGVAWYLSWDSANDIWEMLCVIYTGTSVARSLRQTVPIVAGWNYAAVAVQENSNLARFNVNNTTIDSMAASYTSPSASASTSTYQIFGNVATIRAADMSDIPGFRAKAFAAFSAGKNAATLSSYYAAIKADMLPSLP